jgi:hypothetical protein
MIGSIDFMHWEWKNCPFAWQCQYSGHAEGCTVILEAVASQDLWSIEVMWEVMTACVIMHNMIIEDECDEGIHDQGWEFQDELVAPYPGSYI